MSRLLEELTGAILECLVSPACLLFPAQQLPRLAWAFSSLTQQKTAALQGELLYYHTSRVLGEPQDRGTLPQPC